jgi:hypothetical protein
MSRDCNIGARRGKAGREGRGQLRDSKDIRPQISQMRTGAQKMSILDSVRICGTMDAGGGGMDKANGAILAGLSEVL